MGYTEHNDHEQFTKPKPTDAYAKRTDEMISISLENSHIDLAGLNFDMNHLDSIASSDQLTNYLSNIIHRRNAMTTQTRIDFNDPNFMAMTAATAAAATTVSQQQHSCYSGTGVDNNNSEISVSVRHFSVESRRNSADSQVSQVSVKMSELKARLESRKQKRQKNMIVKGKKRSRTRTNRSHSAAAPTKYKYPLNDNDDGDSMGENRMNLMPLTLPLPLPLLPIEQFNGPSTSDDESQIPIEHRSSAYSADSVDAMDNIKSASSVDPSMQTFLQTNTGNHIEMFNPSMSGLNACRKTDENGWTNGQCQKYTQMTNGIASPPQPVIDSNETQSHFSNGCAHKILSQNGQNCDVGIQANDFEIVRNNLNEKKFNGHVQSMVMIDNDNSIETQQLLLPNRRREQPPLIIRKENLSGKHLSESEKMEQLKRLLLPSN